MKGYKSIGLSRKYASEKGIEINWRKRKQKNYFTKKHSNIVKGKEK